MLTKEDIGEYQRIYLKLYGKNISYDEALEQGNRLINFFKIITKSSEINNKFEDEKKNAK